MPNKVRFLSIKVVGTLLFYLWCLPSFGQDAKQLKNNKETIVRYFDEVINQQKLDRINDFFAQDFIWHQMNGKDSRGNNDTSHTATKRWLFNAIPDVHYTVDHITAEGDMVALNTTVTGTARAELFGLPAGLKKVRFRQMFFYKLNNNKIAEQWEVVDVDGLKAQLSQQ